MNAANELIELLDKRMTRDDIHSLSDADHRKLERLLHHWKMLIQDPDAPCGCGANSPDDYQHTSTCAHRGRK